MMNREGKLFWVGVDVAKESFSASLAPVDLCCAQWRELESRTFEHTRQGVSQLLGWVSQSGSCVGVCVESTGIYSKIFAGLWSGCGAAPEVSIVNPQRTSKFAGSLGVRDKSDPVDAKVLAVFGVVHRPAPQRVRPALYVQLRELSRLREDLVREHTSWSNRLGQALDPSVRKMIKQQLKRLESAVKKVEEQIETLLLSDEAASRDYKRLQKLPGFGKVVATVLLSELGDLRDWSRSEIVSFAGLFPRIYQSGKSIERRPRLAKGGGGRIRRALFMAAISVQSRENAFRQFAKHLQHVGKSKMSSIGAVMRKLLLVARATVISEQDYNPNWRCELMPKTAE